MYELNKYNTNIDEVIICESILNALTCWVYGKVAVALNGTGTPYQYKQLKDLECRKFILALDPDEAGRKGEQRLIHNLQNFKILTKYIISIGKDINDLDENEFKNLKEIFI